jgi:hypothetical protein
MMPQKTQAFLQLGKQTCPSSITCKQQQGCNDNIYSSLGILSKSILLVCAVYCRRFNTDSPGSVTLYLTLTVHSGQPVNTKSSSGASSAPSLWGGTTHTPVQPGQALHAWAVAEPRPAGQQEQPPRIKVYVQGKLLAGIVGDLVYAPLGEYQQCTLRLEPARVLMPHVSMQHDTVADMLDRCTQRDKNLPRPCYGCTQRSLHRCLCTVVICVHSACLDTSPRRPPVRPHCARRVSGPSHDPCVCDLTPWRCTPHDAPGRPHLQGTAPRQPVVAVSAQVCGSHWLCGNSGVVVKERCRRGWSGC